MKKFIALLLTILTFVTCMTCFTACNKDDKTIVIGVTNYEPLDYLNDKKEWIGFDAELATKVFTELGYRVEFKAIDWGTKIITLNANNIDVIWNGMTITDDLKQNLLLSDPYLSNMQYGIVKVENKENYKTKTDLANKKVACEAGSAANNVLNTLSCTSLPCDDQNKAIMEVAAGTSDIAVVDYLLAATVTRQGTDYYGKLTTVNLGFEREEFAVGFRKKDTKLCEDVNKKLAELKDNGFISELATKYNISDALI